MKLTLNHEHVLTGVHTCMKCVTTWFLKTIRNLEAAAKS